MPAPYLSLFSAPKAFEGLFDTIQHNAIQSWCMQDSACQTTLMGSDPGVAEAAQRYGLRHLPDVPCTEKGPPYMNGLFHIASEHAQSDLVGYVNADIIIVDDLVASVRRVMADLPDALMVIRRWDVEINEPIDFTASWKNDVRSRVAAAPDLMPPWGWDTFIFRKSAFDDMPPFVIGRPYWDQWVLYHARRRGRPVVELTPTVFCAHQNHDLGMFSDLADRKASADGRASEQLMYESGFSFNDTLCILRPITHELNDTQLRRVGLNVSHVFCHWKNLRFLSPLYRGLVNILDGILRLLRRRG